MTTEIREPEGGRVQQLSVLLENRVVDLARLERVLERAGIRILAISMLAAADHAVVRLVVDRPAPAQLALEAAGYTVFRSQLIAVLMPEADDGEVGLRRVLRGLLAAELRIEYVYALLHTIAGRSVLAIHVDDPDLAARALGSMGLTLVSQDELAPPLS